MRGFCHGPRSLFLSVGAGRPRVAVSHAPLDVAKRPAVACPTPPKPPGPRPKRKHEPTPFAGLTTKPPCDACEHASDLRPEAPRTPPPRIVPTRGRRRQVDTSTHFCPNPDCTYRGWVGWGNLRANGHPNGG